MRLLGLILFLRLEMQDLFKFGSCLKVGMINKNIKGSQSWCFLSDTPYSSQWVGTIQNSLFHPLNLNHPLQRKYNFLPLIHPLELHFWQCNQTRNILEIMVYKSWLLLRWYFALKIETSHFGNLFNLEI